MKDVRSACQENVFNTYARLPVVFTHGKGCRLWDEDGKEYLDFLAGIAVCGLGHCHPEMTKAIAEQAGILVHVSNLFYTRPQVELAAELTRLSFADKVFFCNSGAEANEAAIKLARRYSHEKYGFGRFHIITMKDSFHGRTMATLSATGQGKVHKGFEPLVEGFHYVDFNSIEAVALAITPKTCAVMVEPIQGEGGVNIPSPGYMAELKALCEQKDLLLIFDEVQTGMGRTGKLFGYEWEGVAPDVMTLSKSLGSGVPIGAMLASDKAATGFTLGSHASTFGGNPLAAAAALRALGIISEPPFLEKTRNVGGYFMERLNGLKAKHSFIREVRGRGLLIGMELTEPGQWAVEECLKRGLIINCTHDSVLRFVPPLVVERSDIDACIATLDEVLSLHA
jgi:acetylornithine aminotransferase